MAETKVCPKCGGTLVEGSVKERNDNSGSLSYVWAPVDEKEMQKKNAYRVSSQNRKVLLAMCCEKCGYVEWYGFPWDGLNINRYP